MGTPGLAEILILVSIFLVIIFFWFRFRTRIGDVTSELEKLNEAKEKGVITEKEFESAKAKLLRRY